MNYQFSWEGSNFICSPVPWFEDLDSYFLSLPGVSAVVFEHPPFEISNRMILETCWKTDDDKFKFQQVFNSALLLAVIASGACDDVVLGV